MSYFPVAYLDLYNSGLSIRAIAKELKVSPTTVAKSLKANPNYSRRFSTNDLERVSFHLDKAVIKQIEELKDYPTKADFLRSAVKEKLKRLS